MEQVFLPTIVWTYCGCFVIIVLVGCQAKKPILQLLGFKKRSDWGPIPTKFSKLMEENGFETKKFGRVKFYGPSKSHIIAYLQKI